MITFDSPMLAPGEIFEMTATTSRSAKLVALDWANLQDRLVDSKIAVSAIVMHVAVNKVGEDPKDGLLFSVKVKNISEEPITVQLDGLERHEIRCDPETGNIVARLERDGSWSQR